MLTPGARLGPYETVEHIGAGGMGEVYRARDERLGRDVAIKVLPAELAGDPERLRRFEQEARATAALNHPNILAVHDVGEHDGAPYLVEELLEGESLRRRLTDGPLPTRKTLEIAMQIANGLAAAHDKGIVHRDLKPENVFLTTTGVVKVLDFGLAKLTAAPEGTDLSAIPTASAPHTALGTVGYMAPEQVRGQEVDQRADIFAFGCLLYEMLSGRRTFVGETAADTMGAILHHEPPELEAEVPSALARIVRHCLEKRPEERFQSARDLVYDLGTVATESGPAVPAPPPVAHRKRWRVAMAALAVITLAVAAGVLVQQVRKPTSRAPSIGKPRIVVLPFENLGAPEDAYFASGMAEEITSRLANVRGLGVISRTTAMGYDSTGKTMREIGADLGVDYVLEGSVRWDHGEGGSNRVRITPQLIRVADDTHVWADRYDRVLSDVFAIQSDVAENAVKAMGVALLPHEQTALKGVVTDNLEAYDLYLRGRELERRGTARNDVEGALEMYQAAVDHDPQFAEALAGLARSHLSMYWQYFDRSQARVATAKELAERAVKLRPDLAETHVALGYYFYWGLLDYPRALAEFEEAHRIQPSNSDAIVGVGAVLRRQGRWVESADAMAKAFELDSKSIGVLFDLGGAYLSAGRYSEGMRAYDLAIALNPVRGETYAFKADLEIAWHGDLEAAQAALDDATGVAGLTDDYGVLASREVRVEMAHRDYDQALAVLEADGFRTPDNQEEYSPVALLRGEVQWAAGQAKLAQVSFGEASGELEKRVSRDPGDHRLHSSLAIAYAGLGRDEEAVREARLGCDLMPPSKDASRALGRFRDLAVVYTMVGRRSEAVATLDDLLSRSKEWTANNLRLDPTWDPLRSDPRFQALLTKYAVTE